MNVPAGFTVVHLEHESSRLQGLLVHPPNPVVVAHAKGAVALVPPGSVAAYVLARGRRRRCLFVFRTQASGLGLSKLPGVEPGVQLLVEARSAGRMRLLEALFRYLRKAAMDPSGLSDAFYLRLSIVLGGRLPAFKVLPSLLAYENRS